MAVLQDAYKSLEGICGEADWFQLPMDLRRRWWRETDYGRLAPSPSLIGAIKDAVAKSKS